MKLTHIDLFSGIGGFSLAARWAGLDTIVFCERDKFCQKVLNKHWPGVPIHDDITTFDGTKYSNVFLLTGGFPCQPFSCAGKRRGKEDDRYLWPDMLRVISETKPHWVIGENVAGFVSMGLDGCISDLEREGYEVQPFIIPACAVNAPHRRDRVWICAHSVNGEHGASGRQTGEADGIQGINRPSLCTRGIERTDCHAADTHRFNGDDAGHGTGEVSQFKASEICGIEFNTDSNGQGSQRRNEYGECAGEWPTGSCNPKQWSEDWHSVAFRTCVRDLDDGVSTRLAGRNRVAKLKALGNSIVPQVAYQIIKSMVEVESSLC